MQQRSNVPFSLSHVLLICSIQVYIYALLASYFTHLSCCGTLRTQLQLDLQEKKGKFYKYRETESVRSSFSRRDDDRPHDTEQITI